VLDFNTQETSGNVDPNVNYLEELVGEGKKFKSVDDLARGKYEADQYINTVIQQKDQLLQDYNRLKADYEATASLKEIADRIASSNQQFNTRDNTNDANEPSVLDFDFDTAFTQKYTALKEQEKMVENERQVDLKLKERFGANYGNVIKQLRPRPGPS
jgi:hypothetical protein